jgi:hypothetical protein
MASLAAEAAFLALFTGKTAAKKVPLSFSHGLNAHQLQGLVPGVYALSSGSKTWMGYPDSRLVGVRHLTLRNSDRPAMPPVGVPHRLAAFLPRSRPMVPGLSSS